MAGARSTSAAIEVSLGVAGQDIVERKRAAGAEADHVTLAALPARLATPRRTAPCQAR